MTSPAFENMISLHSAVPSDIGELYRFSVKDYRALAESQILAEGERAELVDGYVVRKERLNPQRACTLQILGSLLLQELTDEYSVRMQSAITLDTSEPEPHISVFRNGDYSTRHPLGSEVLLVIELLGDSPAFDRHKITLYAEAGIENCWIVDVEGQRIELYSEVQSDAATYRSVESYGLGQSIPLKLAGQTLTQWVVDTILPHLD